MSSNTSPSGVDADGSLLEQLHSVYADRERLHARLGVSSSDELIAMVENLELQLRDFYSRGEAAAAA